MFLTVLERVTIRAIQNVEVESFDTILFAASKHGHMDQLQTLLARINVEDLPNQAQKALLLAAERGRFDVAYLLVKWGAKIDPEVSDILTSKQWKAFYD